MAPLVRARQCSRSRRASGALGADSNDGVTRVAFRAKSLRAIALIFYSSCVSLAGGHTVALSSHVRQRSSLISHDGRSVSGGMHLRLGARKLQETDDPDGEAKEQAPKEEEEEEKEEEEERRSARKPRGENDATGGQEQAPQEKEERRSARKKREGDEDKKEEQSSARKQRKGDSATGEEAETAEKRRGATRSAPRVAVLFDAFFFVYWGVVVLVLALVMTCLYYCSAIDADGGYSPRPPVTEVNDGVEFTYVPTPERRRRTPDSIELPQTMWAMIILAAIGQVCTETGQRVGEKAIFSSAIFLSFLQLGILFLLLHDIDPHADAVTVDPSVPWAHPWSVNSMKWLMCIVISVSSSSEILEIKTNVRATIWITDDKLLAPRYILVASIVSQYLITLAVVWSAMSVVLSFQSCPDIIFSSLAVCFVSSMDDMYYSFVCTCFDLEVDSMVKFPKGDRTVPRWIHHGLKLAALFPLLFGVFLVGRAFYSGVMPYAFFQSTFRNISNSSATYTH